jgi:hypothetical protein
MICKCKKPLYTAKLIDGEPELYCGRCGWEIEE